MNIIKKINLFENTVEEIAVFSSELTRKIESMGLNVSDVIIKINSNVPKGNKEVTEIAESRVRAQLRNFCDKGYDFEGRTYRPFLAGASDARKATATWIDEKVMADLGRWALCGLTTKDMTIAVNKYMAYLGLLTSASKPFAEVFRKKINIRRVAIVDDFYINVLDKADIVTMNNVEYGQNRECEINAVDGFGIINSTLTKGESCTLRGPWLKAYAQAADWAELAVFSNHEPFVDLWGNKVELKDVDVILTKSCFKAAGLYKSWSQYQEAFDQMNHSICVCVREHGLRLKGMPYQQGQTLAGDDDDVLFFANHAHGTVYKFGTPEGAVSLLRGDHRLAAKLYPALLNEGHTASCLQEKYTSKRQEMLGGRIPEIGYNAFLAPDMTAFVQHLFGMEVKGSLKAGECACFVAKKGEVDVTRSPHLDNAHVLLNNVQFSKFVPKWSPTMFINIFDMTTIRLRADYDGDHVWYSQNEWLLDLVKKTNDKIGNIAIDWDVESAPKSPINKNTIANFICNLLHGSEIGIYADSLTKMWNSNYDRSVCDWLTYAGNVLIDAAKHASVKVKKPASVQALSAIPLPEFAKYAKADAEHPADSKYWDEIREFTGTPRSEYSGSFLDRYSRKIKEVVPETLKISGLDDLVFNPYMLMINPDCKTIPGLCKKGIFDKETKTYKDSGVFQKIAFRHSDEWNNIMVSSSAQMHKHEWEAVCKAEALCEMVDYCRNLFKDVPEMNDITDEQILNSCYDNVVRNIFCSKMTEGMRTAVMQCFWRVFGDKCVSVLKDKAKRLSDKELLDLGIDDDDDLFDID